MENEERLTIVLKYLLPPYHKHPWQYKSVYELEIPQTLKVHWPLPALPRIIMQQANLFVFIANAPILKTKKGLFTKPNHVARLLSPFAVIHSEWPFYKGRLSLYEKHMQYKRSVFNHQFSLSTYSAQNSADQTGCELSPFHCLQSFLSLYTITAVLEQPGSWSPYTLQSDHTDPMSSGSTSFTHWLRFISIIAHMLPTLAQENCATYGPPELCMYNSHLH